ncbi:trypsin-like peptidase domain-containing protein [Ornithinibacillus halophilus]|uniref:Zinc-ribbon domain-containing protein n=1 Tax=Ornithinibacillus halophilus TaxID=930117 RepID=A0A1M5MRI8_9BACI|nr:trypsin-like peptidase domain-containing protein [Ornithinibacillus halophilus]SHG79509.1 zinc-ribbon domain-containing protein [Ornithinibacillus halophilus]
MFCPSCGNERRQNSRYCTHCGAKQKRKFSLPMVIILVVLLTTIAVVIIELLSDDTVTTNSQSSIEIAQSKDSSLDSKEAVTLAEPEKRDLEENQKRELTEIIAAAQETVYTIFTEYSQGSGFLYNNNGDVVTNAHVVEGETEVFIKTVNGIEYPGTVIGYSNETDVAVVHVPDLVGREPFGLETDNPSMIGEEIIALGSPLGLENTATMGYITGEDRNFIIGNYSYENLYQISAPISPGSSGGPLITKQSEKIIAINSAESLEAESIGFSIPLYTVNDLIQSWINQPMSEEDILAQFYDIDGDYFFGDLWSSEDSGYFDGGDYSEDDGYYDYWEYDYEDFWNDIGEEIWEYDWNEDWYYDDWYEDDWYYDEYYDDSWYEDGYYNDEYYDDSWYEDEYYNDEYYDDSWYEDEYYNDEYYDDSWYEDEYYDDEYYDDSWYEDEYYDDEYNYEDDGWYDENWYYDEEFDEWYYYDYEYDIWYYYDEVTEELYEIEE